MTDHEQNNLHLGWVSANALLLAALDWNAEREAQRAAEVEERLRPFKDVEATPWPRRTWRMIRGDSGTDDLSHLAKAFALVAVAAGITACFSSDRPRIVALSASSLAVVALLLLAWMASGIHVMARFQCEPNNVRRFFDPTCVWLDDARAITLFVTARHLSLPDDLFRLEELQGMLTKHEDRLAELQDLTGYDLKEAKGVSAIMEWRKTRLYARVVSAQRQLARAYGDITARFRYLEEELSASNPSDDDLDSESVPERIRRLLPEINQAVVIAALARAMHEKKTYSRMLSSQEWQDLCQALDYEEQEAQSSRTA